MKTMPRALGLFTVLFGLAVSASAAAATVTLAWDPNAEADLAGYKVYYDTDSGPPYSGTQAQEGASPIDVPLASLADPTMPSLALHGMPSCTTFYFAVTAYNTSNLESAYSGEIPATLLATPTNVAVTAGGPGALHVTWTGPPAGDAGSIPKYFVNYDTDSGDPYTGTGAAEGDSPIQVATVSLPDPANPSFDLTGLPAGATYYFTVVAACDDGTTKTSAEASGTTSNSQGTGGSGTAGAGGSGGAGGKSGAGGSIANGPGSGPGGGVADGAGGGGNGDGPSNGGGCGCTVAGRESSHGGATLAALALGLLLARPARRRRRPARRGATTR